MQAYRFLIEDYRQLRTHLRLPQSEQPRWEGETLITLESLLHVRPPNLDEVVSWKTLSIVLPAYNEEAVIAETVAACLNAIRRFVPNAEVIVVDDGSRDSTGAIIDELAAQDARVVALHNRPNKGYGGALLTGFAAGRGALLFFMDSDGQFDINEIATLLKLEQKQPGAVILGYRQHRRDPLMRRLNAWGWKQVVRMMLGLHGIRDIDCAFKLFPADLFRACQVTAQGAMVNTELLVKLQRMHVPVVQVPVQHFERQKGKATGANVGVILKAFNELGRTRKRMRGWHPPEITRSTP